MVRRLDYYISKFGNPCNLEKYFNIENSKYENLSINTFVPNNIGDIINLTIKFEKTQPIYYFPNLPNELSIIIHNFVKQTIHMEIQFVLKDDHPFSPPIIKIVNIENSSTIPVHQLYNYFNFKTSCFNERYKKYWNPALTLDKVFIDYFSTINSFEELLSVD